MSPGLFEGNRRLCGALAEESRIAAARWLAPCPRWRVRHRQPLPPPAAPCKMNPSPYHGSCSPSQPFDLNNVLAVCNEVWSCSLASPSLRGTSCSQCCGSCACSWFCGFPAVPGMISIYSCGLGTENTWVKLARRNSACESLLPYLPY